LVIFPTVRVFRLKALMLPRNTGRENIQTLGSPLGFSEAPGALGVIHIPRYRLFFAVT
jgi:hypothetical protein